MEITAKGYIVDVLLMAFSGDEGVTRPVHIPNPTFERALRAAKKDNGPDAILEEVFILGQNDFQPVKARRSVSRGDVIILDGDVVPSEFHGRYRVETVGFVKLPPDDEESVG